MTTDATAERYCHHGNTSTSRDRDKMGVSKTGDAPTLISEQTHHHLKALVWAFTHTPTQEAYRRSTGEDIAPALNRYRQWLEENITGRAAEIVDHDRGEAA